jgi:hypothetical protein
VTGSTPSTKTDVSCRDVRRAQDRSSRGLTHRSVPASARLRAVELYGTKVIPMVRDILAG